jgi:uncharacterized protein (DUF2141 family)
MMPRTFLLVVAASLAGVSAASAQLTRDGRSLAIGSATLSGTVVSDDPDPRPVRRARVTCSAPELTAGLTAITDDRGHFMCARLPAGRYTITAARDGWVAAAYGAKRPLRAGTPLSIAAGQHADIVIRMVRGAVITGTLIDERGQPAVGASVVALRSAMQNGERRLVDLGSPAVTDDRGVYRIYDLPPGDYFVRATPSSASPLQDDVQATTDLDVRHARSAPNTAAPPDRRVAFASTYFPGTPFALQASAIALRPSEERADVDFGLQFVATARIEGTITLPDGAPAPPSTQVTLLPSGQARQTDSPLDRLKTTRSAADGSFTFAAVAPGVYTLLARAATPAVQWASTEISVDGERIAGLSLTLQAGLTIAGQIVADGSGSSVPFNVADVKVVAEPVQSPGDVSLAPSPAAVGRDGRFVIAGVTPGRYRVTASIPAAARARGWTLRSAVANGIDTLDVPLVVRPNDTTAGVLISITDRPSQIDGLVENTAGGAVSDYTVVLFPADPSLWLPRARRIQAAHAGADGTFVFHSLPSGDYLLAATEDVEPGEWFDPAFLQRLAAAAARLTLAEGERKLAELRVGPGS